MSDQRSKNRLTVPALKEETIRELLRVTQHCRSAEAEHREILRQALPQKAKRSLKDLLLAMPDEGADADFTREPQVDAAP
jgi:plasmid stability protein